MFFDIEESIKIKFADKRLEDNHINCQNFLKSSCLNEKCELIHNFSLKNKKENILEFQKLLKSTKEDFKLIEPYETKFIGHSNLDLLFICDCTGSMQPWIEKTKKSIYSIIRYIKNNNKQSNVRVGFVAYRDFHDLRRFEFINFKENIKLIYDFISQLKAEGGDDWAEDLSGGLMEGLKLSWNSNARYAILICDAPDHGSWTNSDNFLKDYMEIRGLYLKKFLNMLNWILIYMQ